MFYSALSLVRMWGTHQAILAMNLTEKPIMAHLFKKRITNGKYNILSYISVAQKMTRFTVLGVEGRMDKAASRTEGSIEIRQIRRSKNLRQTAGLFRCI